MTRKEIEVLSNSTVSQIYILILSNVFYFFSLSLILFLDSRFSKTVQLLDFQSDFLLFLISLAQFYITVYGIVNDELFRVYVHRYISLFLIPYIILNFTIIAVLENVNVSIYLCIIFSIIFKVIETYYTYKHYYEILPQINEKNYKRFCVSEKLVKAYKVREKINLFRDILVFRIAYLVSSFLFFDLESSSFIVLGIVDLLVNVTAMYILLFHIECENIKLRYVLNILICLSLIKDISILISEFFIADISTERKIIGTIQNILHFVIYTSLIYYNYRDCQLFSSGLKEFIYEGKRGLFKGNTRMTIE